ncbi:MAG: phosphatidate cytidylyltransferase [Oscillospiraceae bacterium]|nr:phosphatidate cytidylyltransferase [Oscillospiraceae bacterium]
MRKRIITAVLLIPLLLAILLVAPKIMTAILVACMSALAVYELLYGTGLVRHLRLVAYSAVTAFVIPIWSYFGMSAAWGQIILLVFFCALFGEAMASHVKVRFEKVCICLMAGLLIPYLFSSLVRILTPVNGRYLIMIPFVVAFLSDSGAYFVGCRFGKRKLAPVISPNKSIEGVAGGLTFAVVGMLLYTAIMQLVFKLQVNYALAILYGVLGTAADVFGDLCFSVIKRQTGIKDYGNLIPGHGGILDRFDSMLVVAPLIELLLAVLPVVTKV